MWRRPAAVLALFLALAGCATREPATRDAPAPAAPPAASPTPLVLRTAGPTECGSWTLPQGGELPAAATGCFGDAVRERRAARLRVTAPSVEGDPITTDHLVRADGRVEVTVDARRDRFGSGRIERLVCAGPVTFRPLPAFATCSTPAPV
ncbi:DUF4362 domain-containing protein [Micromonospora sp. I033]